MSPQKISHNSNNCMFGEEDVLNIRNLFYSGRKTKEIARLYQVDTLVIYRIVKGITYSNIAFKEVEIPRRKYTEEQEIEVYQFIINNKHKYSWSQLGKLLNTSKGHMRNIIWRQNEKNNKK